MIDFFESFLYVISLALFYPVVIGLVLLAFWLVLYSGNFIGEIMERRKKGFEPVRDFQKYAGADFEKRVKESRYPDIEILKSLRSWEENKIKNLNRVRFAVRLGPSLGLMGTLIPMGTALASLSQGDMLAMSTNMVTAFTTTIVGIACGSLAYIISLVKSSWLRRDLQDCEIYGEKLSRDIPVNNKAVFPVKELETVETTIN